MELRSPPPSGIGIGFGGGSGNGLSRERAASSDPAGPAASMGVAPDLVVPIGDAATVVERSLDFDQHRGAVGLPGVLLLARPLHAHRTPRNGPRKQCRIGGGIVGAVMAVAARALAVDAADLVLGMPIISAMASRSG